MGALDEGGSNLGGGWNWVDVVSGLLNPNDSGVGAGTGQAITKDTTTETAVAADTTTETAVAAEALPFADWLDTIEAGVMAHVRCVVEGMQEEELSGALSRPTAFAPASCSFSTPMIRSSVNRAGFIRRSDPKSTRRKSQGQINVTRRRVKRIPTSVATGPRLVRRATVNAMYADSSA